MNWKTVAVVCLFVSLACNVDTAGESANASQAKSAAKINWVSYTDTAEGAFSIDVPVGWQVQGGLYRFGYFDARWMMDVRSLDGKIVIRINDVNVPPYALPGPHTGREGQAYAKPQQFQMMVLNYREAQNYIELYAKQRFSSACKTMNARQSDWKFAMPAAWAADGSTKSSEGSAAYDCESSDGPRAVSVYGRSNLFPSSNFWTVDPLISVIAAPGDLARAQSMVQHMADSWRKNPQWEEYQKQMTQMGLQQIQAQFGQFMQQMQAYHQARTAAMNQQVAGFEARQNAQAQQVTEWGENLTGLTNLKDPATGNTFQVFSGPKANYYRNGNGVTVNSTFSPGLDFQQVFPK